MAGTSTANVLPQATETWERKREWERERSLKDVANVSQSCGHTIVVTFA